MFYKIGEIIFCSELILPSFAPFECNPSDPDAVLKISEEAPQDGPETAVGMITIRRVDDGWFLYWRNDSKAGLIVSKDYSQMRLIPKPGRQGTSIDKQYIRIALECLLARKGYVSLHAACISMDSEAIAFTGESGIGKSSRASAWQDVFQASLVSGDRPLIKVNEDGVEAYGVPWDGKEACYRNVHYPLKAICEIRRSRSVYSRKLSFGQKRQLVMQQCFIPMWDTDTAVIQMMNINRLVSRANIIRAFCGPTAEDAIQLKKSLDMNQTLEEKEDMRAKKEFILRNIAGEYMIFPVGDQINQFNGALLINEVSSFIWEKLQSPISREDLLTAITDEYDVDEKNASADLDALLNKLKEYGMIDVE